MSVQKCSRAFSEVWLRLVWSLRVLMRRGQRGSAAVLALTGGLGVTVPVPGYGVARGYFTCASRSKRRCSPVLTGSPWTNRSQSFLFGQHTVTWTRTGASLGPPECESTRYILSRSRTPAF